MANTYGVTPQDIADELPGIFPGGFSGTTKPTDTLVQEWIDTADLRVTIAVQATAGALPLNSDRIAPLAERVIIDRTIAQVLRNVYTANAPTDVENAVRPYLDSAKAQLEDIKTLGAQAAGEGAPVNRLRTSADATSGIPVRDLIIDDTDLEPARTNARGIRHQGQY